MVTTSRQQLASLGPTELSVSTCSWARMMVVMTGASLSV